MAAVCSALMALLPPAYAAQASMYRVASDTQAVVTSFEGPGGRITWTGVVSTAAFEVQRAETAAGEWLPVAYGSATGATDSAPAPATRAFQLGFTPFPYGIGTNIEAILTIMDNVYGVIATNGDLVCHHFDSGVPWPEALAGAPFPDNMQFDLQFRKSMTPTNHAVFLAITPIRLDRNGLAPYRGEQESMPLPPPWNTYTFDHPDVQAAFYEYCRRMIESLEPDYVIIGIEANLLMDKAPGLWPAYVTLHTNTFAQLKAAFPALPIAVSWTAMDLLGGYTDANPTHQTAAFHSLSNHVDFLGLSFHPILSALLADTVPTIPLIRAALNLRTGTVAICETSYPAETFSLLGGSLNFNGSPDKQALFFKNLFTALDERESLFAVNFITIDYDQLWNEMGQPDDINKLWRDTGLYDQDLAPRDALRIWRGKLALPHQP